MINARAETVVEKRAFRAAFQRRRCLVLADGFYEWKKQARRKVPLYIALKTREPFAFAGLWETWEALQDVLVYSCTIITTAANAFMEPIHDRMTVILSREGESAWLDSTLEDPTTLLSLLVPYQSDDLEAYPVPLLVNSTKNDSLACVMRIA